MRLFIAIEFDNTILSSLKIVQGNLKKCGLNGKYTREENLHLTLAFIGEYGYPDKVLAALEELDFKEFTIEIDGIGNFGDLYWAGLKDNPYLISLVKSLRKKLSDYEIPFDRKKFSPHITLMRRAGGRLDIGCIVYSKEYGQLAASDRAAGMIEENRNKWNG